MNLRKIKKFLFLLSVAISKYYLVVFVFPFIYISWTNNLEKLTLFITNNMNYFIIYFILGWLSSFYFFLKFFIATFKIDVNGIYVNKDGESYCNPCNLPFQITNDPINKAFSVFFCNKCKTYSSPKLETGMLIPAIAFHALQNKDPLKTITKSEYDAYTIEHLKSK